MTRDAQIPLFLWVATALLVHLLGGRGAEKAADWVEEGIQLRRFAEGVRSYVQQSQSATEVALIDEDQLPEPTPPPPPPSSDDRAKPEPDETPADDSKTPDPTKQAKTEPKPEPEKKVEEPEKKKPEEVVVKPVEKAPETQLPEASPKKNIAVRQHVDDEKQQDNPDADFIAVRQHVDDEKQQDNPDADFIAEHANKVDKQTQARITSNDQNDPKPTPGSSNSGAADQPGDSHQTRIADSEDRPGEEARPPSAEPAQKHANAKDEPTKAGADHAPKQVSAAPAQTGAAVGTARPPDRTATQQPSPGSKGQAEQSAQTGAPDLLNSDQGAAMVARAQAEREEQAGKKAEKKRELPRRKSRGFNDLLGFGAAGTTANGVNLNLTPGLARDAIGTDQLARERLAEGARRRSQHLGSWKTAGIERWRSAIENYVPSVQPGNQTALNTARSPFGTYLSIIHNRLHPIFADWFLASLDSLPANNPLNRPELQTNLEVVLDADEGRVVKMGVTRASGVTAFDINALESMQRASPFGTPPREIVSPDGKVYLHWEFHRDPGIACTTFNARPFMLKGKQNTAPPSIPAPAPVPEETQRHGAIPRPLAPARAAL